MNELTKCKKRNELKIMRKHRDRQKITLRNLVKELIKSYEMAGEHVDKKTIYDKVSQMENEQKRKNKVGMQIC